MPIRTFLIINAPAAASKQRVFEVGCVLPESLPSLQLAVEGANGKFSIYDCSCHVRTGVAQADAELIDARFHVLLLPIRVGLPEYWISVTEAAIKAFNLTPVSLTGAVIPKVVMVAMTQQAVASAVQQLSEEMQHAAMADQTRRGPAEGLALPGAPKIVTARG